MKQLVKQISQEEVDQMIILKWHRLVESPDHLSFVPYATIGKVYGISGTSVRQLVLQRFKQMASERMLTRKQKLRQQQLPVRKRYGLRFLTAEHVDFLKAPETLQQWTGRTLKERCVLFHRHFGNHRINPTLLRSFYQLHKIKRKRVKFVKTIKPGKEEEYEEWRQELAERIAELKAQHHRIIYLDESLFMTDTIQTMEYSACNQPLRVPFALKHQPKYSIIFAISAERGVEHHEVHQQHINREIFSQYIVNLRRKNQFQKIALFLDNLSVHKAQLVQMKLEEQGIPCLFSVPYQPDYNPCECCFSKIKNHYKRQKLMALAKDQEADHRRLIEESVKCLNKQDVINSINWSLKLLNK